MRYHLLALICGITLLQAQHSIPFASRNNSIELSVANASSITASDIVVEATSAPNWLKFTTPKTQISNLEPNETHAANFVFSIDKSAPVNKSEQVTFTITNAYGEKWAKTISVQVSPPERFELMQNYPNPFNPTTTISYQLPIASTISLKVFDILGKELATLDEGMKEPGYHQKEWNAVNMSSGFYVYQLSYKNEKGEQKYYRKKLLVMK